MANLHSWFLPQQHRGSLYEHEIWGNQHHSASLGGYFHLELFRNFAGYSVPVALRKTTDQSRGESYYTLIDECYVHGMVDGEAATNTDKTEDPHA